MAADDKKGLNTLIILTSAVLVISLVSAFASFWMISTKTTPATKKVIVEKPELGPITTLGEFIVNLADPTESHYLRSTVVLELDYGSSLKLAQEVEKRLPQIKDIVISCLGAKTSVQLQDPENREALKQEVKDKINATLNRGQLSKVYFTSFAVQ
jgi:flagellar FliL protein